VAAPATCCQPPIPDWTGFYVGIHGGGGWGHTSFDGGFFDTFDSPFEFSRPNSSPKGGVFGAQAGYNWQWGPVVGGLEIDFSGADIKETTTFFDPFFPTTRFFNRDFKFDELASARGRLGYLIFPNWLLYGTAGIAWGHSRVDSNEFETVAPFRTAFQRSEINEFGWVAGAGLEWKFWDHWLLRGEWLHYDFGRTNQFDIVDSPVPGFMFATTPITIRTTVDVARAAISYKF
jgi:outer membrane immunogenic protein